MSYEWSECFLCGAKYTPEATPSSDSTNAKSTQRAGYCSDKCYEEDLKYFAESGLAFDEGFAPLEPEQFSLFEGKEKVKESTFKSTLFNIYTGKGE